MNLYNWERNNKPNEIGKKGGDEINIFDQRDIFVVDKGYIKDTCVVKNVSISFQG